MSVLDSAAVRRALELARWAPSAHNAQPWRVHVAADALEVFADPARHLWHSDPNARDLALSLGAFAEALRIGLEAEGASAVVESGDLDPHGRRPFATVRVSAGQPSDGSMAALVRRRQTSRLAYSARDPETAVVEAFERAAKEQGLTLRLFARGTDERKQVEKLFFAAAREGWLDPRNVDELRRWIVLDPEGVRRPEEGMSTNALGLGWTETAGFAAMLRPELWKVTAQLFVAPLLAETVAKAEAAGASQAPFYAVLVSEGDARQAGAAVFRTWLEATRLGLALHPISTLIDRRGWELARMLKVGAEQVALAFRLGKSAPPPRAGRRPVDAFARL